MLKTPQRRSRGPRLDNQTIASIGLHYVCYRLSRLGWNVLPTSRNARGVDIVIYNQSGDRPFTIQVKSLSERSPVPLGTSLQHLFADFVIICRKVSSDSPACFVLTPAEVRGRAHRGEKDGRVSFWLQPKDYESDIFKERWEKIGLAAE